MSRPASQGAVDDRGEMDRDGLRLSWRRIGRGRPLVLINGYAATCDDWDPAFLDALSASFSLICPENRGMGGSDLGAEPLTVQAMAADVVAILDHLEIGTAPVAGWSMGGYIAQQIARTVPGRVDALVLLATDPGGPKAVRCSPEVFARLTDHSGAPRAQARRLIDLLFPTPVNEQIDRDFGELVAAARATLSPATLDAQADAMNRWHAEPVEPPASATQVPVLAATGALDAVIPAANSVTLAAADDAWLARFEGGGHAFMAQEPQRLAALIEAFLAG